jgi:hypothetical protein
MLRQLSGPRTTVRLLRHRKRYRSRVSHPARSSGVREHGKEPASTHAAKKKVSAVDKFCFRVRLSGSGRNFRAQFVTGGIFSEQRAQGAGAG